ncbi:MAG: PqqD family protein [Clostridia bacterium]|nr:PqqD family protein [Clostridia bacterium]
MKKQRKGENYLDKKPRRKEGLGWSTDEKGIVTLEIQNRGFFNRLFQLLLKKPKVSFVHLDEMGSFLWPRLDGEKDLVALGEEVKVQFGEKAEPLYERLAKYVQILHSYGFVNFN